MCMCIWGFYRPPNCNTYANSLRNKSILLCNESYLSKAINLNNFNLSKISSDSLSSSFSISILLRFLAIKNSISI